MQWIDSLNTDKLNFADFTSHFGSHTQRPQISNSFDLPRERVR